MSFGSMTELDAVNRMLLSIGEQPVTSLLPPDDPEDGQVLEADAALRLLNETRRDVLAAGWHFNTERGIILQPDDAGEIHLPANTLRVDMAWQRRYPDVVQRGNRLYNRVGGDGYRFERPLSLDLVLLLPFVDCIHEARAYITVKAARAFSAGATGSTTLYQLSEADEFETLAALRRTDALTGQNNIIYGNRQFARIAWRDRQ